MRGLFAAIIFLPVAACSMAPPPVEFIASNKSAVELRSMQSRLVPGNEDTVMRGVVGTLHDLGYRITKVESGAGTVSATRQTTLRMAVVIRPKDPSTSVVRANATVLAPRKEGQGDSPDFYLRDFFEPLGATLQRQLAALPDDMAAPDAARPVAEINTHSKRKASIKSVPNGANVIQTGTQVR